LAILAFERKTILYLVSCNLEIQKLAKVIIPVSALRETLKRRKTPFQKDTTLE
jgi:hypothetical protein